MSNNNTHSLNTSSTSDLVLGYTVRDGVYSCLVCGRQFEDGIVYNQEGTLHTAERAVREHILREHGDMFHVLLGLGKEGTGLSDIQQSILSMMYKGFDDRSIARELGDKSASTIRNHRFQLRRKAREARVFLAIMELLEGHTGTEQQFIEFHADIPTEDERVMITLEEAEKIRKKAYTSLDPLRLNTFPKKQKAKLVILKDISELFERDRHYSEKEVNDIILPVFDDYVTIRRYLIEYRFLERKPGGRDYIRRITPRFR